MDDGPFSAGGADDAPSTSHQAQDQELEGDAYGSGGGGGGYDLDGDVPPSDFQQLKKVCLGARAVPARPAVAGSAGVCYLRLRYDGGDATGQRHSCDWCGGGGCRGVSWCMPGELVKRVQLPPYMHPQTRSLTHAHPLSTGSLQ